MKILRSWLEDFVDLGAYRDENSLVTGLIRLGIEIEEIEHFEETSDGARDFALAVEVTPNRSDLLSHFGVARELAAMFGLPLKSAPRNARVPQGRSVFGLATETDGCPRYCGLVVRNVRIAESPAWMRQRLERVGLRPISNVVDATNYVLLELNHPVHAFDLEKLTGGIVARDARKGEKIALLDGREYVLEPGDVVIADESGPVALGGVMGGFDSSVTAATHNLLLEAAWFAPSRVRRTARRLGISTDSSYRFERVADPEAPPEVLRRLAQLIVDEAGGEIDGEIGEASRAQARNKHFSIRFRGASVRRHLGCDCADSEKILTAIGCRVEGENVTPPSWRADLEREIDLVEEIARFVGYDRIPSELPALAGCARDYHDLLQEPLGRSPSDFRRFRGRLDEICRAQGFDRCSTLSFERAEFGEIEIHQPLNSEQSRLRNALLPAVCRVAQARLDKSGSRRIALFELDKVFRASEGGHSETVHLAVLAGGLVAERRYDGRTEDEAGLDHAIGLVREIGRVFGIPFEIRESGASGIFMDSAEILCAKDAHSRKSIGRVGAIEMSRVVARSATSSTVDNFFGFEIDLLALFAALGGRIEPRRFRELPRFPASQRDLAFLVPGLVNAGDIVATARAAAAAHLEDVVIFDLFVPHGKKERSIGLRLTFRSAERTLTDEEIGRGVELITSAIENACGAKLRSGS